LPLLPLYYCLISLASALAFVDLIRRPFHWAKTEHGLARTSIHAPTRGQESSSSAIND